MGANYRLVATEVGDLVKWDSSVNEIERAASAILGVVKDSFPHEAISSIRAQTVYDWVLSLAQTKMNPEERDQRLVQFCRSIITKEQGEELEKILRNAEIRAPAVDQERRTAFDARRFHSEVVRHSQRLFVQGNYFHAVFEASKSYNKLVREKAKSIKNGESLMLTVWGCDKGVLKITQCETETDQNVQDGIKFLSTGLMRAIRNPTAHEPAVDWPISQDDCLDILSFVSFLFRKLDDAVFVPKAGAA